MQPTPDGLIYIVDDDASVRDALAWLLRSRRLLSEAHASAHDFLNTVLRAPNFTPRQACCIVLDVRMPGLSGLTLFDLLTERGLTQLMPVIFLTGHADVPTAVDAVKRGAFDFFPKPFSDNALVDRVEQALVQSAQCLAARHAKNFLQARVNDLTEREQEVMQRVVEGLPNKLIADHLGISVRTVEVHRARVFDKMEVKSAVELANVLREHAFNATTTAAA
jgi:two-component system, LuxR family, response regulator DctR